MVCRGKEQASLPALSPDPFIGQLRSVVVGIVVPLCCICVLGVGAYFIHYLVWGKEEKWPQALVKYTHSHTYTHILHHTTQ